MKPSLSFGVKRIVLIILAIQALLAWAVFGGDVAITWDASASGITDSNPANKQRAGVVLTGTFLDALLYDNGMPLGQDVLHYRIAVANLGVGGPLAATTTGPYVVNSRGFLVLDAAYEIVIRINNKYDYAHFDRLYLCDIVLHEMLHGAGMDPAVLVSNHTEGGALFPYVPDNQYIGPAMNTYRLESNQPFAAFVPLSDGHLAYSVPVNWFMTPGISLSHYPDLILPKTVLGIVGDNGWTVNPNFTGGLLRDFLAPAIRRYRDEDEIVIP